MEEIQSAHHGKTDNLGDNDNKLCQCYAGVGNSTGGGVGTASWTYVSQRGEGAFRETVG